MTALPPLTKITAENVDKIRLLKVLGYGNFRSLAWSPDEKLVAVATSKGIWLHDAVSLQKHPDQLQTSLRPVNSVAFSPDSQLLASAEDDGAMRIWKPETRDQWMVLWGHSGAVMSVKFSLDGTRLYSGGSDSSVRVWDVMTGMQLALLRCETKLDERFTSFPQALQSSQQISHLVLSPLGDMLAASGVEFANIFLWDTKSYSSRGTINPDQWKILALAFINDAETLVARTHYGKLSGFRFWNVESRALQDAISIYVSNPEPHSQKGTWVLEQDEGYQNYQLMNTKTGQRLSSQNFDTSDAAVNANRTKAIKQHYQGTIELWDLATNQRLDYTKVSYRGTAGSVMFNSDGTLLVATDRFGGGGVQLWELPKGEPQASRQFPAESGQLISLHFVASQKLVRVGYRYDAQSNSYYFVIWDVLNERQIAKLQGHERIGLSEPHVAFSPNGSQMVSSGADGTIRLWDLSTSDHKMVWHKKDQKAICTDFSSDGMYVAVITDDIFEVRVTNNVVRILDVNTNEEIMTIASGFRTAFSPDASHIFVTTAEKGNKTHIWNIESKVQVGKLPDYSPYVERPIFVPDSEILALPRTRSVELWDWRNQVQLAVLEGFRGNYIAGSAVSPDGKLIAVSSGHEGEIFLWGVADTG